VTDDKTTVVVQPPQGVVGVASSAIGALQGQPNLLLVFLLNAVFIGALFFYLIDERHGQRVLFDKFLDRCLPDPHPAFEKQHPAGQP
jgi:hypothetical protein